MSLHSLKRGDSTQAASPTPMSAASATPSCPVCRTAEVVCGKWTLLVIRDLAEGSSRFCELERSLEGISPRTLSLRLRALEEEGIVERHTFPEVPPRVEYALTEKGEALVPLIEDMRALRHGAGCRPRTPSRPPPPSRRHVRSDPARRRAGAGAPGTGRKRGDVRDFLLTEALKRLAAEAATRFSSLVAAATRSPSTSAESEGPDSLFHSYVPADRALRARARGRAARAAGLRPRPRRGRTRPASPRPTWRPAARRCPPTRASAPRAC